MTLRKKLLTPEILLSAPRRSSAIPSPDGKLALFTKSTYSFSTHSKSNELCVLDIATGQTTILSSDGGVSDPKWLNEGSTIVWLKQSDNGNTSFVISDATSPGKTYTAGTVSGPISNLKVCVIEDGAVAIAVSGQANPDGSLFNEKGQPKSLSSARLYSHGFVRHWDKYVTAQRNSIFTALLQKSMPHVMGREGIYHLVGFKNALQGTDLESPIPPFGGTDHFDVGPKGLVFVAKDPALNPATHTRCICYFLPLEDLMDLKPPQPVKLQFEGIDGAATCPVFSPDGKSIAVLQMRHDGYETDRNLLCFYHDLDHRTFQQSGKLRRDAYLEKTWDLSPNSIIWSQTCESVFLTAEDTGANCLFELRLDSTDKKPIKLTSAGNITGVEYASTNSTLLFISSNSLISNSTYYLLDPAPNSPPTLRSYISPWSTLSSPSPFGLSEDQVSSIFYPSPSGTVNPRLHAWLCKPSFFNPDKRYPLAFLIHGGPQGAWLDQWSTRWNPLLFAEQGYVVLCPNPTGSTSYGQKLVDAIAGDWGGAPYRDLVALMDFVQDKKEDFSFVDLDRAVALGASYGGYMINYLQGQPLGRRFKALVCHDGVFSLPSSQSATEELYFPLHDFKGPFWERMKEYDRFDPARYSGNWATPQLTVHSSLDYRLPISEGLAAFNVLQMRGVESAFLHFSDENHWVLKPENSLVWHSVVVSWINKFVGLPELKDGEGRDVLEKYCVGGAGIGRKYGDGE